MHLKTGTLLQGGKYRIEKVLGQGGFGITYKAYDSSLDTYVAVKEFFMKEFCNRDPENSNVSIPSMGSQEMVAKYRDKFLQEAKRLFRLNHKSIVRVFGVFEENDTAYYVMEYLSGGCIKERIPSTGFPEDLALKYIRQVADALSYIHDKNIQHLDVKPANIMFREKDEVVLIDFGISKHYDGESGGQTSSTPVGLSEGYAPAEQYRQGGVSYFSPATDIYALGATLYKFLTGTTPVSATLRASGESLASLPEDLKESTRKAVMAAMQLDKSKRPQTISEFISLLDSVDEDTYVTDVPDGNSVGDSEEFTRIDIKTTEKEGVQPEVKPQVTEPGRNTPPSMKSTSDNPGRKSRWWILLLLAAVVTAVLLLLPKPSHMQDDAIMSHFSEEQIDSVSYLVGVNFASFYKSNKYHGHNPALDRTAVMQGIDEYVPHEEKSLKYTVDEMTRCASRYTSGLITVGYDVDTVSYFFGINCSSFLKDNGFIENNINELDLALMEAGFQDFMKAEGKPEDPDFGTQFRIDPDLLGDCLSDFLVKRSSIKAERNLAAQESFLKSNSVKEGVVTTSSGLQYKIERPGEAYKPKLEDTVRVNYRGTFLDGTMFDEGEDISFPLDGVIKGWTEGLGYIGKGGKITLYIPSDLGYGERGNRTIEPNSLLIFEVELLDITKSSDK